MLEVLGKLMSDRLLDHFDDDVLERLVELLELRAPTREPLLKCSEAAERASVHVETIRRAVRGGKLRAAGYVSRSPRIAPADLEAWLGGNRQQPSSQPRPPRPRASRRPLADAMAHLDQQDRRAGAPSGCKGT